MAASLFRLFSSVMPQQTLTENAPLSEYTTMRVGGPAALLCEPQTEEQLTAALSLARRESVPVLLLGNGSNLLVSDAGFDGLALHVGKALGGIVCEGTCITAGAGALLTAVSRHAAENSLTGLEFASGIPGSVGGAVCMNAGAYGGEIAQVLTQARVFINGETKILTAKELHFGYRHSLLMEKEAVVLSAEFLLSKGEKSAIDAQMADLARRRREKQPLQFPSCGSFFKRPEGHFAGALIEQAGLKGFAIGGAQVSELHAGFLINRGSATASDVYALMRHVQQTVLERFGVTLEPEVRLIGRFES